MYLVEPSLNLPYHPISTTSDELSSAKANKGSSIVTVVLFTVVVVPLTVKSPEIVTSLERAATPAESIVIAPEIFEKV